MHQAKVICLLDIRPGDIRLAIGRMPRERGKGDVGARQRNKALSACKRFCEQMRRDQKMRVNPLADLEPWDERTDQRRQHVAYDEGIAEAVIEAAAASKEIVERLTGPQRSMLYRTAAGTGFRKRTLCGLTVADLHLKASTPFIRVTASNVKNKVARDQVISVDLCRWLASYTRSMKPKDRLFPFRLSDNTAAMMRHDLRSIGVEYEATPTSFRDFHSWRNTFGTDLGRTANIKVVQEMMGHSTPVLTARYMRPTLADYSGAVESLPKHGAQRRRKARSA
jgi:integrase